MYISSGPSVRPEIVFIEDLLEEIAHGKVRVPKFQRPFFWKPSDMLSLFDSIYKEYPIGSLLLWESDSDVASLDEVGPLKIPSPGTSPLTYILDGHQRLATLYGALRLPSDYQTNEEQQTWRWRIYFDLTDHKFTHAPKGRPAPNLLPLRAVLRTVDFLQEARKLQETFPENIVDKLIIDAEQFAQKVKNYKVAIIRIRGGDLSQAVEIFSRLNTRGRQITADQMVSALTYREGEGAIDLAERIDYILEELSAYRFENLSRLTVFRAIMAAAGMNIYSSDWESLSKKVGEKLSFKIDAAGNALFLAARFLYEAIDIPGDKLLPYSHQMVLLSEFFHNCPNPDSIQLEILKKWFWVTSLSGWFAGANSTQINNAIDEMRDLAKNFNITFKVMPLDDPARKFPNRFDMRSARIRILLIFMLKMKPLNPDTGERVEAERILHEYGTLLHIFPRVDQPFVSNPANRILLEKKAGQSTREQLISIPEKFRDSVLESHGITPDAYEALLRDDAVSFINYRAQNLYHLERNFMSSLGIMPPEEAGFGETDVDADEE